MSEAFLQGPSVVKGVYIGIVTYPGYYGGGTATVTSNTTPFSTSTANLYAGDYTRWFVGVAVTKSCRVFCLNILNFGDGASGRFPKEYVPSGSTDYYYSSLNSYDNVNGLYSFVLTKTAGGLNVVGAVTGRIYQQNAPAFYMRSSEGGSNNLHLFVT